jgi:2-keto-4-pentenoate hydratase/2-oxohepta-3-ene-1,7-dioic acid hydratase in catechol pathway
LLLGGLVAVPGGAAPLARDLSPWPRVVRFVSEVPPHRGQSCYGLVVSDDDGVPVEVASLAHLHIQLCREDDSTPEPPGRLRLALATAESLWRHGEIPAASIERIAAGDLARRILAPVHLTRGELDTHAKVVIGAGLNYATHRDEVGAAPGDVDDLLLFPKPALPTGAYAPVGTGIRIGSTPPAPVVLMDHEVELGFVLLQDVDLARGTPARDDLHANMAFFAANDVSDREPIFVGGAHGYARAKGHRGYLPVGPWMVHGKFLRPRSGRGGDRVLRLELRVRESDGATTLRQSDTTRSMHNGPAAILRALGERYRRGDDLCMPDAHGRPRRLHDAAGIVPAGSVVLTGTPGGTAAKAPGLLEKIWLLLGAGFSVDRARRDFFRQAQADHRALGYLEPGEQVQTWVEHLGRQRWRVVASEPDAAYGERVSGGCASE